jgi:transcriptional regulator with XRE-family HTH domain
MSRGFMSYRNIFAERFKELRAKENISLAKMGDVLGVKSQSVSTYEHGKTVPSFDTLMEISEYFNVSLDWLTGRTDVREVTQNRTNDG